VYKIDNNNRNRYYYYRIKLYYKMSSSNTTIPTILDNNQYTNSIQITSQSNSIDQLLEMYMQTLSEKERRAYMIAKSHLGSSFDLSKSVGFVSWKSRL